MQHHSGNKIDGTVTHLLMYTKELIFTLEQWARNKATEEQVSDVYVKLGNEFNLACRCFVDANVDISDLGDVPMQLRNVLERALSENASQQTLDNYLPSIREIIVTLLQQLKHKQTISRQSSPRMHHARAGSNASSNSIHSSRSRRQPSVSNASAAPTGVMGPSTDTPMPPSQSPKRQPSEKKDHNDALTQLQKSQALERRASKRFSSYHMARIMNGDQSTSLPTTASHATHSADFTDTSVVEERSGSRAVSRGKAQTPAMSPVQEQSEPGEGKSVPTALPQPSPKANYNTASQPQPAEDTGKTPIFLRLGKRIRKGLVSVPYSLAGVRLQFVDLFGYTPQAGEVFPDMTIQDHDTGVEYELTEATLRDIKKGSLLTLCAKTEQEAAVDTQIKELVGAVQDLSTKVDARLGINAKATPPTLGSARFKTPNSAPATSTGEKATPVQGNKISAENTDGFRQELAIMRQICQKTVNSMRQDVKKLKSQIVELKAANAGTNRGYMTSSTKKLTDDTQKLITWVDDLQDMVEAQRKDVASRGVRLSQKQLDGTNRQIQKAHQDLRELQSYIANENPIWVKTWETELNTVVQEQQFFKLQEQLVNDLESDLQNAKETFELVEQCALELSKSDIKRNPMVIAPIEDPQEVKHELLGEIVALKPNHAERAEAIERAERVRKRELEMRGDDFKQELGDFVEEGKLKKSGGVEEVERRRKERDEIMREEQRKTDAEAIRQKELAKEERRRKREAGREDGPEFQQPGDDGV